jgi:hypothetical protein
MHKNYQHDNIKKSTDGVMDGMLLIAAEENELVVFNLVGISNLSDLSKIGGKFGVPNIDLPGTRD